MYRLTRLCLVAMFGYFRTLTTHEFPAVDFVESMLCTAKYTDAGIKTNITSNDLSEWQDFGKLYEQYIVTQRAYSDHERIPKIIHHIWLGSQLPNRCKEFIETWKKLHPQWKFILWDDAQVAKLNLINQRCYDAATNYGEKSDIARYEILYRFGGLYVDTDFEALQSFNALHHCCDFYVGAATDSGGGPCYVFNGLLASIPGHPVLRRCIEGIQEQGSSLSNRPDDIINRTGPLHLTRCLNSAITATDSIGRCVVFPPTYFYSWPGVMRFNKNPQFIKSFIRPESLAIHHWASSWL